MFCPNGSNHKTNLKVPIPTNKHLFSSSGSAGKNVFIRSSESKKCIWKDENEDFHQNDFFSTAILGSQQMFGSVVPGQRNNLKAFPSNILNSITIKKDEMRFPTTPFELHHTQELIRRKEESRTESEQSGGPASNECLRINKNSSAF